MNETNNLRELFSKFMETMSAKEAIELYSHLKTKANCQRQTKPLHCYEKVRDTLLPELGFSQKALFSTLDQTVKKIAQIDADKAKDDSFRILIRFVYFVPCALSSFALVLKLLLK